MKSAQTYPEEFIAILSGEASEKEREAFFNSLSNHPEKEKRFLEAQEEWSLISDFYLYKSLDTETAWQEQKSKLFSRDESGVGGYSYLKWAAAFIGIILLTTVYLWTNQSEFEMAWVENNNGEITELLLDDGSTITLNRDSRFRKEFKKGKRFIELEGEAFFQVTKSNVPFIVESGDITVKVLGTSFNVRTREDMHEVVVATGSVEVSTSISGQSVVLSPGEKAFSGDAGKIGKKLAGNNDMSWLNRQLRFEDEQFSLVLEALRRTYYITFEIENDDINSCKLTANFENEELSDVLSTLSLIFEVEFAQVTNERYLVRGTGCVSE